MASMAPLDANTDPPINAIVDLSAPETNTS
jgi:hypothetical protein